MLYLVASLLRFKGSVMRRISTERVDVRPEAADFWRTQGHQFQSFTQAVNEFIDNAVANFAANSQLQLPEIRILVEGTDGSPITTTVIDSGTGIEKLDVAFRVGDTSEQDGVPSEHGVGLKHSLAYLDGKNASWKLATRTSQDISAGSWRRVTAPYDFGIDIETVPDSVEKWPGSSDESGTVIQFVTPFETFRTLAPRSVSLFETLIDYFIEDVAYTYSGLIERGLIVRLTVNGSPRQIGVLQPQWVQYLDEVGQKPDIKAPWNPRLKIDATFGLIQRHSKTRRRYHTTMSSSGIQIRINGRVVEDNIFSDIWNREKHNSFNAFLGIVDLRPEEGATYPATVATKNGFRRDDPEVIKLFDWIAGVLPNPPKQMVRSTDENELRDDLRSSLLANPALPSTARCDAEFDVYTSLADANAPAVDLAFFGGETLTLIECKLGSPKVLDLYQLLMQWDGAIADGRNVEQAWLVGRTFSDGLNAIVADINSRTDPRGNRYNISLKPWSLWFPDIT